MKTFDQIRGNSLTEASATAGDHEDAAHAHRTASKQPKMDLRAVKAHEKAAEHHDTAAKHLKTGNAYAAQNAHINAKNEADKAKDYGNVHSKRAHADTRAIGEGYASDAQRKAIWAAKNDKKNEAKSADVKPEKYTDANGKTKVRMVPVVRENDANEATSPADLAKAMAAYKAKGGKVTKAPAAKAQGYHGKDDPGKDIAGIMDRPDTKKMGTRKKVKSMEAIRKESQELAELSPELLTRYAKKAIPQQFKKNDAAKSPINRGTEKGAKLQKTADKRKKGIDSVRKRSSPNDVGQHKTGKASRPHGGMRPGKGTSYKQKPAGGFNSKYLDQ